MKIQKTLAPSTIQQLIDGPITVRTMNGSFEHAEVAVSLSKGKVELYCELTHPLMEQFDRRRDEVTLIVWSGSRGCPIDVPAELLPKVDALRKAATLSDDVAASRAADFSKAVRESYISLGIIRG